MPHARDSTSKSAVLCAFEDGALFVFLRQITPMIVEMLHVLLEQVSARTHARARTPTRTHAQAHARTRRLTRARS